MSIVPHTHWDREWYAPFQIFRARLVAAGRRSARPPRRRPVVRALPARRADGGGRRLPRGPSRGARPPRAARCRRAASQWARGCVLMDEFMVSGETIVRDLQLGIARAGGARRRDARRLPPRHVRPRRGDAPAAAARGHRARGRVAWRAGGDRPHRRSGGRRPTVRRCVPSTSTALLERARLPRDPELLVRRARGYVASSGCRAPGGATAPHERLRSPRRRNRTSAPLVAAANGDARTSSASRSPRWPSTWRGSQPVDGLPTWHGELRSGARANVLMGVASNRCRRPPGARRPSARSSAGAEPLQRDVRRRPTRYPHRLLGVAWRNVVLNTAHDSSARAAPTRSSTRCACATRKRGTSATR